jgi:hypothetical protein
MKTSSHALAICGILALSGGAVSAVAPTWQDDSQPGFGSATAYVVHPMTGDGLPGMPVTVIRIITPDPDTTAPGTPRIFTTGPDGSAFLSPLEDGRYEAYVDYNNNRSESVFFVINSDTDYHPVVTIFFNPDIDPGAE